MPSKDVLRQRLGWKHPILQAPLAGGGDTPELVAAVCNAESAIEALRSARTKYAGRAEFGA